MNQQQTSRSQTIEIDGERLPGKQVNGNGIVRKRVEHDDVETLRRLAIEHQTAVSGHNVRRGGRTAEKIEKLRGGPDHRWIDFVEAEISPLLP